jgi:histidine triad (HIT) family protein
VPAGNDPAVSQVRATRCNRARVTNGGSVHRASLHVRWRDRQAGKRAPEMRRLNCGRRPVDNRPASLPSNPIQKPENAMSYDNNNPFARILRGELPCVKIAEDDATVAIMDVMPQADGHVLVIPKEPAAQLFELSGDAAAASIRMTQRVAAAVRDALGPDGMFIGQFNGAAAGQTVPHVHFHVIPRWEGVELRMHARDFADAATLEALAQRIRARFV